MKTISTLFAALLTIISLQIKSQTDVYLEIKHKLHGEDFSLNQETFNDLGIRFSADRLQYYISGISVTHDSGMVTDFPDKYILVTANIPTNVWVGEGDIDSVESISFHIGVDEDANHSDPSSYPSSHALAHKNPEMHWGWTAGYRFVAIEGDIGPGLENDYNFHALGDDNYYETTVDQAVKTDNGEARIRVYANYAHALNALDIADGFQLHSEIGECKTILENFRDYVFSSTVPIDTVLPPEVIDTVDTTEISGVSYTSQQSAIAIFPNPVNDHLTVQLNSDGSGGDLLVYNAHGQLIRKEYVSKSRLHLNVSDYSPGIYFISHIREDGLDRSSFIKK